MAAEPDELSAVLLRVYERYGQREPTGQVVSPQKLAGMTSREVALLWDFDDRLLMHEVAKAISR